MAARKKVIRHRAKRRFFSGTSPRRYRLNKLPARLLRMKDLQRPFERPASTRGLHSALEPYRGPKEFSVADLQEHLYRGRLRVVFWVRRDELLFAPYGGFRVSYHGTEIGRTLSFPAYEDCLWLRRHGRKIGHAEREAAEEPTASGEPEAEDLAGIAEGLHG